jgi:hypothetical protein
MKWDSMSLLGLAILVFGVLSLLSNVGVVDLHWNDLWPLTILGAGIAFELGFFLNRQGNVGLLVPGGILTVIGAVFLIATVFGWDTIEHLWPFFVLAPAAGLFQLYLFGGRNRVLLIPTSILAAIGFVFLVVNFASKEVLSTVIPILMIAFGGFLLLNSSNSKQR